MDAEQINCADQSAIEFLAQESQESFDDIAPLYKREIAKLEADARIKGFLSIFAIKNVRKLLHKCCIVKPNC